MKVLKKNRSTIELSEKQIIVLGWLFNHTSGAMTAFTTWQMLFNERDSKMPDVCISIYDGLTPREKIDVELIFSRFIAMKNLNKHRDKNFYEWIQYLSYEEV